MSIAKNSVHDISTKVFKDFGQEKWWKNFSQPSLEEYVTARKNTDDEPYPIVSVLELVNHQVVQKLVRKLAKLTRQRFKREVIFPLSARIKTFLVFMLAGNGNLSHFYRQLTYHKEEWGRQLGYNGDGRGQIILPAYKTLYKFMRLYLGPTIEENVPRLVAIVIKQARTYKIRVGQFIITDSTPHHATKADYDAKHSPHHKKKGYKEQRIIDYYTDIPVAFCVSSIVAFDGDFVNQLLQQVIAAGCQPTDFWGDGHYITKDLLPLYVFDYNLHVHAREKGKWKGREVTEQEITQMYQKLWKQPGFKPEDDENCTHEFKLRFIWKHSPYAQHRLRIGEYFIMKIQQAHEFVPDITNQLCGIRSTIERGFGQEKRFSAIKAMEWCSFASRKSSYALRFLTDLVVSLFWMDQGRTKNLTSTATLVL